MSSQERFVSPSRGYAWTRRPSHSDAFRGSILEHRWVMEQYIDRPLPPGSIVHHRNEQRDDNRLENLLLMRSEDDHFALHRAKNLGRADLVDAHETWAREFMENLKRGLPLEQCYPARPITNTPSKSRVILRKRAEVSS